MVNSKQALNYNDVSAVLVNYEVRRKDKQSSFNGILAEALTIKGTNSNRKGKGVHQRSESRGEFRDLKKNQCAFCKEIGHWNVDCQRINDKNNGKESKNEANLAQVISSQAGTSQAGGLDSNSSVFSFSITTPTIGYSSDSEWILDTGATIMCARREISFLVMRS